MDQGYTVTKFYLYQKIPEVPQNLFGQSNQLAKKIEIFGEKKTHSHWASVVRNFNQAQPLSKMFCDFCFTGFLANCRAPASVQVRSSRLKIFSRRSRCYEFMSHNVIWLVRCMIFSQGEKSCSKLLIFLREKFFYVVKVSRHCQSCRY